MCDIAATRHLEDGWLVQVLNCAFPLEQVTVIEPALSAWESVPSRALTCAELRSWLSASDREIPVFTGVNGTLMARRPAEAARSLLLKELPLDVIRVAKADQGRAERVIMQIGVEAVLTQGLD